MKKNHTVTYQIQQVLDYWDKGMQNLKKKSESLQTEGRHFRSMICKLSDV